MHHARLEPALSDREDPGALARCKGFVKTKYTAVGAVAVGSMDRKGGAKASTVGLMCRGRNDVLAHGNSYL